MKVLAGRVWAVAAMALGGLGLAPAARAISVDHLSVLTYHGKVQIEALASDDVAVKDIAAFDATGKLLYRRDCPKAPVCRAVFVLESVDSPQRTVTVLATATKGGSASEVFTAQVEDKTARVYVLSKISDEATLLPLGSFDFLTKDLVAGAIPAEMMASESASGKLPSHDPTLAPPTLTVGHYQDGDKLVITAKAKSKVGMDSIAILEDGLFLDVELCSGEKTCTFTKILGRQSGKHTYMFKARTVGGAQKEEELLVDLP